MENSLALINGPPIGQQAAAGEAHFRRIIHEWLICPMRKVTGSILRSEPSSPSATYYESPRYVERGRRFI
jgi:hypothetical protein